INEIRWDIRPAPHWGTVEVRVCDGVPTLEEILAITAFIQCLVDDMSARLDAGETLPTMPDWFHNENKWRAARYGMDAIIIENAAADERLVTECLTDEIERLSPVAERLGCVDELHSITSIIERGVPYQRLQRVFQSTGSLTEVTRSLIGDLRNSYSCGLVGPGAGPGRAACATICAESTAPSSWRTGLRGAQICAARRSARGTDLRGAHASCGRIRRDSREYFAMDPPAGDTQPPGQLPTCGRPQTVVANGDFCAGGLRVLVQRWGWGQSTSASTMPA